MPGAPLRLRCEFRENPLGVTHPQPHFSWWVNDPRPAELQTAYEIECASNETLLLADAADLWCSGAVASDRSTFVKYAGAPLSSGAKVWWRVRTYDSDGVPSPWSESALFQMGLLHGEEWQAKWIGGYLRGSPARAVPAVALRREIVLDRPIKTATLYVCALGDYRLEINGKRLAGVDCPAVWSDFSLRAYYQVFDVKKLLLQEPNCIGVVLTEGYYAGELAQQGRMIYGDQPLLRLQLHVDFVDGSQTQLNTDESWRWYPAWVLAAEINGGEHVDARQYIPGWSDPGLDDDRWMPVDVAATPSPQLQAQTFAPLSIRQVLRPVNLPNTERSGQRLVSVYDFGDALLGRVQIDILSNAPDNIALSYALDGEFEQASVDSYMSRGDASGEIFTGQFALHGFRYLRVEYTGRVTKIGNVSALRMDADNQPCIRFRSDHPSLNELYDVLQNSTQVVALSRPLGGLAPIDRFADVALASTWVPQFAKQVQSQALVIQWLNDLFLPALEDDDTCYLAFEATVATVWSLYRHHNNLPMLRSSYPALRVAALSYRHCHETLLRPANSHGVYGAVEARSFVATATFCGALDTLMSIAEVLNQLGDVALLESLRTDVRHALRQRFVTYDGHLGGTDLSFSVAALYYGLLEPGEQEIATQTLINRIEADHYHFDIAPVLVHSLLPTLTRAGRLDIAYMVLLQTSAPSWLASIDGGNRLIGRNAAGMQVTDLGLWEWFVESLIGLTLVEENSADSNGYRKVRICPRPPLGKLFLAGSPVQLIEASVPTVQGSFEIKWWIDEDRFELELLVPPGCSGWVTMPDDIEQPLQSGHHRFSMGFAMGGDGVPILLDMASSAESNQGGMTA